jgi:hypothetical protein
VTARNGDLLGIPLDRCGELAKLEGRELSVPVDSLTLRSDFLFNELRLLKVELFRRDPAVELILDLGNSEPKSSLARALAEDFRVLLDFSALDVSASSPVK